MIAIGIAGPTKKYLRRDVDNMSKVILDAGNKIIYNDDRLINIWQ
jgi:Holliday junction resolvase RusA-like endonuclease